MFTGQTRNINDHTNPFLDLGHGKKSKIYEYCQSKGEEDQCIWLFQQRGRKMFAREVSPLFDSESLYLYLQSGFWLNKYSFYGNIGIRQIEVQCIFGLERLV